MAVFSAVLVYASLALATTYAVVTYDYIDPESIYTVHSYLEDQQVAIKDYVSAIKSTRLADAKIKEIVNKEFDGFTKYAKGGLKSLLEQAEGNRVKNKNIIDKMSSWMNKIDRVNKPDNEDDHTAKHALDKFENTAADLVKQSEEFNAKVLDDPYESPRLMRDLGNFIMNVTSELRRSMKRAANQIKDIVKPPQTTTLPPVLSNFTSESFIGNVYIVAEQ
ncbi:uncharacterized protein LOC126847534 [Adelges cooleyi]|uniref:uncharacterized protein LOC126847534 n=1 Tax=Adelges cooleyi TaxID=133065 RepID=UPI00217F7329|nr:uncharacterized protein LOC126847534 [Adelges cooleyi]